jgi:hypothetical protein
MIRENNECFLGGSSRIDEDERELTVWKEYVPAEPLAVLCAAPSWPSLVKTSSARREPASSLLSSRSCKRRLIRSFTGSGTPWVGQTVLAILEVTALACAFILIL